MLGSRQLPGRVQVYMYVCCRLIWVQNLSPQLSPHLSLSLSSSHVADTAVNRDYTRKLPGEGVRHNYVDDILKNVGPGPFSNISSSVIFRLSLVMKLKGRRSQLHI